MSPTNQLCNKKKYQSFLLRFVTLFLLSFATNYTYAQCGAGDVGGTVFLDLPMNGSTVGIYGVKATNEPGISGITVKITESNGTVTTKTTDATGKWFLDAPVFPVKVEFAWKIAYPAFESSPVGTNSKTSLQVITSSTCSADFALHNPFDYTQSNPNIVTTCFANGTATGTAGTEAAIVSVKYNSTGLNSMYTDVLGVQGTGPMPNMDATINKVGSVYGVAYQKNKKRGFYSTFLKRHVGILDGTGYIYVLDHNTAPATYATKFNLQGLAPANAPATTIDFGSVCRTAACGAIASNYVLPADKTQPSVDLDAFGKVGRVSMGDIDLGPDNNTLFVTNLNSNSIITVDVSGTTLPGTVKEYKVATLANYPTSTKGSLHIFALEFHNGKGYLGVTDDASISKLNTDLKCYVLEFDPANITAGFTQKLVFNPNARKTVGNTQFNYWINTYVEPPVVDDGYFLRYTQPMLSDIEFDQYGTMYLTIMDRFGHQIGQANHKPISGNTDYQSTQSFGDLLKACNTTTGYVLEGSTGCTVTASEFFDDTSGDCSIESIVGSSLLIKGSDQIITTNFDPYPGSNCGQKYWNTQGFNTSNTTTGAINNWYSVYQNGNTQAFGKANGLGDLEVLAAEAPIEIGNRVWKDTDEDGIQDPNESSLVGVTVKLYNSSDVEIASTTTDSNGEYLFSSATTATLLPNTNYKIKITSLGTNASVVGLLLTNISPAPGETSESTNTGTTTDNSDAFLVSNIPTILVQTADAGENNHTYDFGFKCKPTANAGADKALNCTTTSTIIGVAAISGNTYSWSPTTNLSSATVANPTASPNVTTTYTLTVTSAAGCTATDFVVVMVDKTVPTAIITGNIGNNTNLTCVTTSVTRTASGGGTYLWSNSLGTNASVNITTAGNYTVTITSANGCTATATTAVTLDNTAPTAAITGTTNLSCVTTSITRTASGGGSYVWSNNLGTNASVNIISAGTYTVTVTNVNGCTATATTAVTIDNTVPTATIVGTSNLTCATPSVSRTASGGGTYLWSNSLGTSARVSISSAGTYTVTVIAANGCTSTATTTVTSDSTVPQPTTASAEKCGEGTLTLSASGCDGTYNWYSSSSSNSSLATTASFTTPAISITTLYYVSCTVGSCISYRSVATATINEIPKNVTTSSNNPIKEENSLNLNSTSTGGTNYSWTGPNSFTSTVHNPTIDTVTELMEGVYTVTVSSPEGCTATATTSVIVFNLSNLPECTEQGQPTVTASSNTPIISGSAINLSSIATGAIDYAWEGPNGFTSSSQNPSITNSTPLMEGVYTVSVTVDGICKVTATTNMIIRCLANPTANSNAPICVGGTLNLSASGANSYTWSGPNNFTSTQQNPTIINVLANAQGVYTVTLTGVGCTTTVTTNVVINALPVADAGADKTLTCTTKSVVIGSDGIYPNATYSWTPSSGLSSTISPLPTASPNVTTTYVLTITNSLTGCTATDAVVVTVDESIPTVNISLSEDTLTCTITQTILTANVSPAGTYSYQWSNNGITSTTTLFSAGTITLAVTAANGCVATATTIIERDVVPPTASISGTDNLTCTASSVTRVASGGGSYLWSNNLGTSATATISAADAVAGTYTVTVTSKNGCTATATTSVTVDTGVPTVTITATEDTLTCTKTQSVLTTDIEPTGIYTYLWSNGSTASSINVNDAGTYSVEITAANGCKASASVLIVEFNTVTAQVDVQDVDCKGGNNGSITVTGFDGIAPYKYKLNAGTFQSNNVFSGLTAGTYAVAIQDAGGCTASINVIVREPLTSIALTVTPTNLKCNGAIDGQIQAIATGGTPAYTFAINGGAAQSNSLFTNLIAGTYTIIATDTKGCSTTATTEITQPTKLVITAIGSTIDCSTPKGTITATVTGGTPAYQYSVDGTNFQPSNSFANLNGGTYTITVKDLNLCVGTGTAAIIVADTVKPTFTSAVATMVTCTAGDANNDGKLTLTGVINGVSYQYSAGGTFNASAAIPTVAVAIPSNGVLTTNLPNPIANSQFYTIRIFNSNGCYKDLTVELLKRVCACKPEICVPVLINKAKSK